MKTTFLEYSKTLPISKDICTILLGEPKTHAEWADRFNIVGRINKILINEKSNCRIL